MRNNTALAVRADIAPMIHSQPLSFKFDAMGLRVVMVGDEPWFVALDVCRAIGIDVTAIRKLDEDEKDLHLMQTPGGEQKLAIVSESGLYMLILRSRDAMKAGTAPHRFRRWVSTEVLPSIRKTGGYGTQEGLPPIDVRDLMLRGQATPTVSLSPYLEGAIDKKAWEMAREAYEISREHLKRRVAYSAEQGYPVRRINRSKALASIRQVDLGYALTHLWHTKVELLNIGIRIKAGFLPEIADCLDALVESAAKKQGSAA